jgi:hypothetical protein
MLLEFESSEEGRGSVAAGVSFSTACYGVDDPGLCIDTTDSIVSHIDDLEVAAGV